MHPMSYGRYVKKLRKLRVPVLIVYICVSNFHNMESQNFAFLGTHCTYMTKIRNFLIFVAGTSCTFKTELKNSLIFVAGTLCTYTTKIRNFLVFFTLTGSMITTKIR